MEIIGGNNMNNPIEIYQTHECPVTFYNLETIISVGYRIKSPQGVVFRPLDDHSFKRLFSQRLCH